MCLRGFFRPLAVGRLRGACPRASAGTAGVSVCTSARLHVCVACVYTRVCVSRGAGAAVGAPWLCHGARAHSHKPRVSSPLSPSPRMVVIIFWLLSKYRRCHGNNKTAAISGSGSAVSHCKRGSAGAGTGSDSPSSAPTPGTALVPQGHAPSLTGAAGAPGRGRVAAARPECPDRSREVVAGTAFPTEQTRITLGVCAQPGGCRRGWSVPSQWRVAMVGIPSRTPRKMQT